MRIGISNSVAGSPVVKQPNGVVVTPPVISNVVALCLTPDGDEQQAEVWTDVPCLFQYRTKIGSKGTWTAWSGWTTTPVDYRANLYFETSVPKSGWYVEINAKDENGVMASNNAQGANLLWDLAGNCIVLGG